MISLQAVAKWLVRTWRGRFGMPILLVGLGIAWLLFALQVLDLTPLENSEGYLMRSEHSLFSKEFYFGPRPFVTSLMYKFYGSTEAGAVRGQLIFSTFAWLVLTFALGRTIQSPTGRLLHCLAFPSMMAWWNIMGWNMVMRAESTAFSWLALWCAALSLHCQKPNVRRAAFLAVASFFLCFTRDSVPLIVLPVVTLILLVEGIRARLAVPVRKHLAILGATLLLTAGFQFWTSQSVIHPQFRTRHEFPLVNVIIRRVLPKPDVRAWFAEQGMPVHTEILRWKKPWASGERFAIFKKKKYRKFRDWVREEGKYTYLRYLASHPVDTLSSALSATDQIFSQNLDYYTHKPPKQFPFRSLDFVYPLVTPSLALLVGVWGLVRSLTGRIRLLPLAFAATIPLAFFNGLIVYHMDAMEVPRHALLGVVLLHIAAYALFLAWQGQRRNSEPD